MIIICKLTGLENFSFTTSKLPDLSAVTKMLISVLARSLDRLESYWLSLFQLSNARAWVPEFLSKYKIGMMVMWCTNTGYSSVHRGRIVHWYYYVTRAYATLRLYCLFIRWYSFPVFREYPGKLFFFIDVSFCRALLILVFNRVFFLITSAMKEFFLSRFNEDVDSFAPFLYRLAKRLRVSAIKNK